MFSRLHKKSPSQPKHFCGSEVQHVCVLDQSEWGQHGLHHAGLLQDQMERPQTTGTVIPLSWSEKQNQKLFSNYLCQKSYQCVWFLSSQFQPLPVGKTEMRLTVAEAQKYLWFPDTFFRWVSCRSLSKFVASVCNIQVTVVFQKVKYPANRIGEDTLDPLKWQRWTHF